MLGLEACIVVVEVLVGSPEGRIVARMVEEVCDTSAELLPRIALLHHPILQVVEAVQTVNPDSRFA